MSGKAKRIRDLEAEMKGLRQVVDEVLAPLKPSQDEIHARPSSWGVSSGAANTGISFSIFYGGQGGFNEDGGGETGVFEPRQPIPSGGAGGIALTPTFNVNVTTPVDVLEAIRTESARQNAALLNALMTHGA